LAAVDVVKSSEQQVEAFALPFEPEACDIL